MIPGQIFVSQNIVWQFLGKTNKLNITKPNLTLLILTQPNLTYPNFNLSQWNFKKKKSVDKNLSRHRSNWLSGLDAFKPFCAV